MTATKELIALAERCDAASGPDRELDAAIACVAPICTADYVLAARPSSKAGMVTRYFDGGGHGTFIADRYTSSIDAAMTLVPEGWWGSLTVGDETHPAAVLHSSSDRTLSVDGYAAIPALALCAAALRALASQKDQATTRGENG